MIVANRSPFWRRAISQLAAAYGVPTQRSLWIENGQFERLDESQATSSQMRRWLRSDADMAGLNGAVFAAIRRRVRMVTRIQVGLVRDFGTGDPEEIDSHPALEALHNVNDSLTARQGFGLIEQHKLTAGKAYWIKRRNRLGVPVEFEIWNPEDVKVVPEARRPWVPESFKLDLKNGSVKTVAPIDVVWFRHLVDPRNPLNGLSPIGAIRTELDTGLEAQRFNQRFFDAGTHIARTFSVENAGTGEVERIAQKLEREFTGTDKMHRALVLEGNVKPLEAQMSFRDMEFMVQLRWTKEQVATAFELSLESLSSGERTYENQVAGNRGDWDMIVDQVENTLAELTEFFLWPDFGREYRFVAKFEHINALQPDRKLQAEIDAIHLSSGARYINELRERDGVDAVDWGDVPIVPNTLGPLDTRSPEEKAAAAPPIVAPIAPEAEPGRMRSFSRAIDEEEMAIRKAWARRLDEQAGLLIAHFEAVDKRVFDVSDVDGFDWDWLLRYRPEVVEELALAFMAVLDGEGFVSTPLTGAQELAVRFAERRAGEMLRLDGRDSVVKFSRERVRTLVSRTIEQGDSLQTLAKSIREDYGFSRSRAMSIANTETQNAIGTATVESFQSQGFEGKRWVTAGDGLVCPICSANGSAGAIPVNSPFPSGHSHTPGHPGLCRCKIEPVFELRPRRRRKTVERDGDGRISATIEEDL